MDFKKFKKNRKKLREEVKKMVVKKPSYVDKRFWALTTDKLMVGEAIIRFLPLDEGKPVAEVLKHVFKEKSKWFFENCPKTLDMKNDCPVCDHAQIYWDRETDEDDNIAIKFSKKRNYISNILVIKDPAKPENNGKVFLYKFGVKIYEKLMTKLAPTKSELIEEEPEIVNDLWEGKNFHLISKKVKGYKNYDDSKFQSKETPVGKNDKEIAKICEKIISLDEFTAENQFKPFKKIEKKFNSIMGFKKVEEKKEENEKDVENKNKAEIEKKEKPEEKKEEVFESGDDVDNAFNEEFDDNTFEWPDEKDDMEI